MNGNLPPQTSLTPQELSLRRLNQLAVLAENIRQDMPEFMGMTAFGSIVRGAASPESDVDICVFMEATYNPVPEIQNNRHITPDQRVGRSEGLVSSYVFNPAIDIDYKMTILGMLPEDEIAEADIIVLPINDKLTKLGTDILLESAKHASRVTDLTGLEVVVPRNVRCLFNAPVDSERLQPHIRRVLKQLADSEYGPTAWKMIRHLVIGFEQGRNGSFDDKPHRTIPETLNEAMAFYKAEKATT